MSNSKSYQCRGGGSKSWEPVIAHNGSEAALSYADYYDLGEGNAVSVKGIGIYRVAEVVKRSMSLDH